MNIQESVKAVLEIGDHTKFVKDFAQSKYDEKFPVYYKLDDYYTYDGYVIISETKIRIDYSYLDKDQTVDSSFIVDLVSETRNDKIIEILK